MLTVSRCSAVALVVVCMLLAHAEAVKQKEQPKEHKPHLVKGNTPLHNAARTYLRQFGIGCSSLSVGISSASGRNRGFVIRPLHVGRWLLGNGALG